MSRAKPLFKPCNLDQNAMVVINYQKQLQPGTFEQFGHISKATYSNVVAVRRSTNACRILRRRITATADRSHSPLKTNAHPITSTGRNTE